MAKRTFNPSFEDIGYVNPTWDIDTITNETCVYAASPAKVKEVCGPIANEIMNAVPDSWWAKCVKLGMLPNIDVRVHRLNKGEYPAVPGWHCDGALRETYFGQPDPDRVPIRDTILCVVSTAHDGVSNPQMITIPVTVDIEPSDSEDFVYWREVHKQIKPSIPTGRLCDGEVIRISCDTLHRVMPAHKRGARLLFRMSMWHNDYLGDGGKVAKTQQVYRVIDQETIYVTDEGAGW